MSKNKMLAFYFSRRRSFASKEIDAQKRVIFEIKSPFNLRLEPEFSAGFPIGEQYAREPKTTFITLERLYLVVDWCFAHRDFDPEPMTLPRNKYPVIHEWQY